MMILRRKKGNRHENGNAGGVLFGSTNRVINFLSLEEEAKAAAAAFMGPGLKGTEKPLQNYLTNAK